MKIKEFIEMGERKAGTQKELAKYLNIAASTLRIVKSGRTSLDPAYCIKLARFINKDEIEVIAASRLVIEKDEEKRKIFESCFKKTSQAACIGLVLGLNMIMTPIPAKADITTVQKQNNLYYVNRRRTDRRKDGRRLNDKIDNLIYRIGIFFLRGHYA